MIIDRTHVRWGVATFAASLVVAAIYVADYHPDELPIPLPAWLGARPPLRANVGATPLGLIYGSIALLIFIFAALLGWRRNHPSFRVGPLQLWLKAHIWLTLFTVPLVLFHCGFHGGGPMTQFLLGLYAVVMVSGFLGLALQHIVPKMMREYLPEEVIFEQIPYIQGQVIAQGEAVREKLAEPSPPEAAKAEGEAETTTATLAAAPPVVVTTIIDFLDREGLPYLKTANPSKLRLRNKQVSDDLFRLLKLQAPESIHPDLEQLQSLCDEKRRLDLQTRLQHWLHGWLFVHAPASLLLVIMTFWHAIVTVFFYE